MRVIREKPCQRRYHRVTAPLYVTINGERCQTADWSLGGLRIDKFDGSLPDVTSALPLMVDIPFQGFSISFELEGTVVRHTADGQGFAVAFTEVPERARDLMQYFIEDLIRGQMATVDGAICRIDIPVTPISTKPDPNPVGAMPVRRWPLRTILTSAFYLTLGVTVFAYVGVLIYANLIQLEIETAVISTPVEAIAMPVDGTVAAVLVEPGSRVRAGEALLAVRNRDLEAKIEDAEIDLSAAKAALDRARRRLEVERRQLKDYQLINETERGEADAGLSARLAALEVASRQFERISALHEEGHATERQLDLAHGERAVAKTRVDAAQAAIERATALSAASTSRHHNGREFIVDLDLLRLEIEEREAAREEATARLAALLSQRQRLFVRAPFEGRFTQLLHPAGAQLTRGVSLAVVEEAIDPVVEAFLNQEEVLQVGLGDEATIYLPALRRRIVATVVDVDRTSGFVDEQRSRYTWRGPKDRSARIVLELPKSLTKDLTLTAGLPAVVVFKRRTTREIFARIAEFFDEFDGTAHAQTQHTSLD